MVTVAAYAGMLIYTRSAGVVHESINGHNVRSKLLPHIGTNTPLSQTATLYNHAEAGRFHAWEILDRLVGSTDS